MYFLNNVVAEFQCYSAVNGKHHFRYVLYCCRREQFTFIFNRHLQGMSKTAFICAGKSFIILEPWHLKIIRNSKSIQIAPVADHMGQRRVMKALTLLANLQAQ